MSPVPQPYFLLFIPSKLEDSNSQLKGYLDNSGYSNKTVTEKE